MGPMLVIQTTILKASVMISYPGIPKGNSPALRSRRKKLIEAI